MTAGDAAVARAVPELAFAVAVGDAAQERWPAGDRVRLVVACAAAWAAVGLVRALGPA